MTIDGEHSGSQPEDAMVAALLAYHRSKQRAEQRAGGSEYERILGHFERRAQRAHAERLVTSELLGRLLEGARRLPTRPSQQELELIGPPHGVAAGRFSVRNRTDQRADFELVWFDALGSEPHPELDLRFEPSSGRLDAGEAMLVRVAVNLRGLRDGQSVTLPVECRWPGGRDRLWVVARAEARGGVR